MPTSGTIKVDAALTQFVQKILPEQTMIAPRLFPVLGVTQETDVYHIFGTEHLQDNVDGIRADGDTAKRIDISATTGTYQAIEYAFETAITDRERRRASSMLRLEQSKIYNLIQKEQIGWEKRVNTIVMDTSVITQTAAAAVHWDSAAGTKIKKDIQTGIRSVELNCGMVPNTIVIPPLIADVMNRAPELENKVVNTHSDLLINDLLPQRLWGLEVLIPGMIQDSRKFAAASASMARIWDDDKVLIAYVSPMVGIDTITLGSTMRVNIGYIGDGSTTTRYREDNRNQDVFGVSMLQDEKLVSATCGYIISDCTTA